jgi:hypothetical protein
MQAHTWSVQFAYLPSLSLGDVLTFDTPETYEGGEVTVTGLLSSLRVSYDASPKATMSGTVESFEDIGSTNYVIGNLILDADMKGTGVSTEWNTKDGGGTGYSQVADGFAFLSADTGAANWSSFWLEQTGMTVGESYTFTFDYLREDGSENLDITISDSGGTFVTAAVGTSGSASYTITCRQTTTLFGFTLQPLTGSVQYRVWNTKLTSAVTA